MFSFLFGQTEQNNIRQNWDQRKNMQHYNNKNEKNNKNNSNEYKNNKIINSVG